MTTISPAGRVLALALTEVRLVLRNRTVAVSAVVVPMALGGFVLAIAPVTGWWQALVAVPGAAMGQLAALAMTGGTWATGLAGLPAVLPAVVARVIWPVVFGAFAMRRFRWDPRR